MVTRSELYREVWPDTIVEYDQGLNTCLRSIRAALGDDARHPIWIQTIPRRGYCFLAEVVEGTPPPIAPVRKTRVDREGGPKWWRAATVIVVLGVVAIAVSDHTGRGRRPREVTASAVIRDYRLGDQFLSFGTWEGAKKSIPYFEAAVASDSAFVPGYIGLALAHLTLGDSREARDHARYAVALNPTSPSAQLALARVAFTKDWDFPVAERAYTAALHLAPNWGPVHHWLAYFRSAQGRHEEALAHANRLVEVDPISAASYQVLGWIKYRSGDFEGAQLACERAVELSSPGTARGGWLCLASVALAAGDTAVAARSALRVMFADGIPPPSLRQPTTPAPKQILTVYFEWLKRGSAAFDQPAADPYVQALAAALMNDKDAVFEGLVRAVQERNPLVVAVAVEPRFRPLRHDPRFRSLIREIGLPESAAPGG